MHHLQQYTELFRDVEKVINCLFTKVYSTECVLLKYMIAEYKKREKQTTYLSIVIIFLTN